MNYDINYLNFHGNLRTYRYGSLIKETTDYEWHTVNEFIPPGQVLYEWLGKNSYVLNRTSRDLPVLTPNESYSMYFNYTSYPKDRLWLKIIFYDGYTEQIDELIIKKDLTIFTVPKETTSYSVQLINAGVTTFTFKRIVIVKSMSQLAIKQPILFFGENTIMDSEKEFLTIVFTEPERKYFCYSKYKSYFSEEAIFVVANTYGEDCYFRKDVREMIEQKINHHSEHTIGFRFIGSGPISNQAVVNYAAKNDKTAFAITGNLDSLIETMRKRGVIFTDIPGLKNKELKNIEDLNRWKSIINHREKSKRIVNDWMVVDSEQENNKKN